MTPSVTGRVHPKGLRVAVVGAGLSGLAAASSLTDHGLSVQVFDKGRGAGGRTSTRRHGELRFDHGSQYFTVRDKRFRTCVDSWLDDGVAAPWDGVIGVARDGSVSARSGGTDRFVGTPGMNALARHLAEDVNVSFRTRVDRIERNAGEWGLFDENDALLTSADAVLVTAPPPQSADLLSRAAPSLAERVRAVHMQPCRAVMVTFDHAVDVPFDGLFVHDSPIGWACRNNSKPGRPADESWVLHATPEWSSAHLESSSDAVSSELIEAFFCAVGTEPVEPTFVREHRWRYALADEPLDTGCLWDAGLRIGACGDWCHGSRIEGAFLSGMSAADRVLELPDPAAAEGVQVPGVRTDQFATDSSD